MSRESSSSLNSQSESSSSSSTTNQVAFFITEKDDITDLTLFGSPAPVFKRTGTVIKRTNSVPVSVQRDEKELVPSNGTASSTEEEETYQENPKTGAAIAAPHLSPSTRERLRKCLEGNNFRLSLDSALETNGKSSSCTTDTEGGTTTTNSRSYNPTDSSSSQCTDYAIRSCTETNRDDKTLMSPSSSYLSWIESVNSEYFGNNSPSTAEVTEVDNKVGEWNNFWLNYNSSRGRYLSSPIYACSNGNGPDTADEMSEVKSSCSTQRDNTDKNSIEMVSLTYEEASEAVRCTQRITDILHNAMKRSEHDSSNQDSYYSPPATCSRNSSTKEEQFVNPVSRERSVSCGVDPHLIQKQKQLLMKTNQQSSSTSCINAILTTGVADILKRVISKRREVMTSDDVRSGTRSSFSEWSTNK